MSRGSCEAIHRERQSLFKSFEESVSEKNPSCLAVLRRRLQSGPITTLYSGGGGKFGAALHTGFSLRMPAEDVADWQMKNTKGQL